MTSAESTTCCSRWLCAPRQYTGRMPGSGRRPGRYAGCRAAATGCAAEAGRGPASAAHAGSHSPARSGRRHRHRWRTRRPHRPPAADEPASPGGHQERTAATAPAAAGRRQRPGRCPRRRYSTSRSDSRRGRRVRWHLPKPQWRHRLKGRCLACGGKPPAHGGAIGRCADASSHRVPDSFAGCRGRDRALG